MRSTYPPDADASDVFGISEEAIERILNAYESQGEEEAQEVAIEVGLPYGKLDDLLDWFGCD